MKKHNLIFGLAIGLTLGAAGTFAVNTAFKDVPENHWATDAVNWAKNLNLIEGYQDGTFQGDKNLTRYEMVQILSKYDQSNKEVITYLTNEIKDLRNEIDKINENDGVITSEDKLTEAEVDLNGDGVAEKIVADFGGTENYPNTPSAFTLSINDQKIEKQTGFLQGYFRIVDIDKKDKFKEIIIGDLGPSNDYTTLFYAYDGQKIIEMGKTQGVYIYDYSGKKMMDFPGSGIFKTLTRGQVLQTWYYEDEYGLNSDHTLKHLPKDLYEMGTEVTMLKDLPLQTSRTDAKIITTLKTGDKATLLSTDNKQWVLAEDKNGIEGWFELEGEYGMEIKALNLSGTDVFKGLVMAD